MDRSIETTRFSTRSTLLLAAFLLAAGLCTVVQPGLAAKPPDIPTPVLAVIDGEPISAADLSQGNWVLAFVIFPDCPACEQVITWFGRAAQTFPEVRFLLVTPRDTPELISFVNAHGGAGMRVLLDSDGPLGARLEVTRAPTVFLVMEGAQLNRLDWPFTEQELMAAAAEMVELPDPAQLVGKPAPEFAVVDLAGRKVALADLPRPLLLLFFDPYCPPCWITLPALAEISQEVAVVILAVVGEEGLSDKHRARFAEFLAGVGDRPMNVLLLEGFDIFALYKVGRIPTYILIDEQGVITWTKEGLIDEQGLRDHLCTIAPDAEED